MLNTSVLWHSLKWPHWLALMQTHADWQFDSKLQLPGFILGEFSIIVEFIVILTSYSTGTITGFSRFSLYFALLQDSPQDYSLLSTFAIFSRCILHILQDLPQYYSICIYISYIFSLFFCTLCYYCLINLLIVVKVFPLALMVIYMFLS